MFFHDPSPFFSVFNQLSRDLDSLFPEAGARVAIRQAEPGRFPPVVVGETKEDIRAYFFAPGLDAKSLEVSVQNNLLRVAAERKHDSEFGWGSSGGVTAHRRERVRGAFSKVVSLPDGADPAQVHATYEDGILSVMLGKRPESKPRRIDVNARQ